MKKEIQEFLESRGYRYYGAAPMKSHATYCARRLVNLQIVVEAWDMTNVLKGRVPPDQENQFIYNVEITNHISVGKEPEQWFNFNFYSVREENLLENLSSLEEKLILAVGVLK